MENKCLSKTILKLLIFHICKIMFIQRCGSGTAGVGNYTVYRSSCRRDGLFQITDSDMKLKNGIIVSSSQKDLSHCARQCVKTIGCLSLNFSPSILQNSNCEILDNSKEDNGSVMEATSGWKHYEPVVSIGPRCRVHRCPAGYICKEMCDNSTGYLCQDIDECISSPCQNNGACSDEVNKYTCTCSNGWDGTNCQKRKNYALGRPTSQLTQSAGPERAVDGLKLTNFGAGSCTHTDSYSSLKQWWRVDLGISRPVFQVSVTNRGDCCADRLAKFSIYVGDVDADPLANKLCYSQIESVGGGATKVIDCTYTLNGRYVYVSKYATGVLTLCEVEVYTDYYDNCASNPCSHMNGNAICKDRLNSFTCLCAPGSSGSNCEKSVLYYISSDTQTWTNARSKCQSMGGDLVTMTTAEENAHVKSLLSSASSADYWMGLTDISLEGDWMYVDGSRPTFPDWDPGEPSGDGDCNTFRVSESYRWNDIGCGYSRRYVCKTPAIKHYYVSTDTQTWNDARAACQSMAGDLVIINDAEENMLVKSKLASPATISFWIGLTDSLAEGVWRWTDGSGISFADWADGEPNDHEGQDCGAFNYAQSYKWDDQGCSANNKYVCEITVYGSCQDIKANTGATTNGKYFVLLANIVTEVYCDMSNGGWTLAARFSNNDASNWMASSGAWWYDNTGCSGSCALYYPNADMRNRAFQKLKGNHLKITKSTDSSHAALLTASNCLGGKDFRSKMASYGNFRNGAVWGSNQCRGSCSISYGPGSYSSTAGFAQSSCSSNLQSSNYIGFWCDWSSGDGAVVMIGGGGDSCGRADHGLGITEADSAKFGTSVTHKDFGDESGTSQTGYALNLWVK